MTQVLLIATAGLLFLTVMGLLGVWWRQERRLRQEFFDVSIRHAQERLVEAPIERRRARELENAAKIDQRMAEFARMIME